MKQQEFLALLDQARIVAAISEAELQTSGEIRVHVQPRVGSGEIRDVAERTFERLGMTKTVLRNGVLLFIASEDQRFVILGDSGINERVPAGFWDEIAARLTIRFQAAEYTVGIAEAIKSAGRELRQFFPRSEADVNELANDINIDA
jgi:uncharacterized membrane protein